MPSLRHNNIQAKKNGILPSADFIHDTLHTFVFLTDINECATGVTNCTGGKLCVNTRGGYQCVCPGGRYGMNCKYSKYKITTVFSDMKDLSRLHNSQLGRDALIPLKNKTKTKNGTKLITEEEALVAL